MRVISGRYRGKKLKEFNLSTTKPTLDRVKESIFNLIQFDIQDAVVCDLFSGTGALGIECISRGAKFTYLIDSNPQAISIIKDNLRNVDGDYKVVSADYMTFLSSCKQGFDIFLLDPPFNTDYGVRAIEFILKNKLLNTDGIIIFETSNEYAFDFSYLEVIVSKKKYGTVAVYKIQKGNV